MLPTPASVDPCALVARFGAGLSGNFWRLWGSAASANLADGVVAIAIPLAAVRLGASPAELAGIAVAMQAPMLLFGLVAGGLADRIDRRRTMLAVQLLRVAVIGLLAALALFGGLSLPALYLATFILGSGEAFFDTNAQSILPSVVGRERLVAANGRLFATEMLMNSFVGPPLGGILVAVAVPLALTSAAAGFALAALGLVLMTGTFRAEAVAERRRLVTEIGEGVSYLLRHRLLLTLTSMVALGRMGSASFALLPLYAVAPGPMGLSEPQFGLLLVAFGGGSVLGSVVVGTLVKALGRRGVLLLTTLLFGVMSGSPAVTNSSIVVGGASFVAGVCVMAWNVTNVSLRQSVLPPHLMGRVHATHRVIANLAGVLGAALAGAIGELFGLQAAFAAGAAIILVGLLGGFVVTEPRIAAAEATAEVAHLEDGRR